MFPLTVWYLLWTPPLLCSGAVLRTENNERRVESRLPPCLVFSALRNPQTLFSCLGAAIEDSLLRMEVLPSPREKGTALSSSTHFGYTDLFFFALLQLDDAVFFQSFSQMSANSSLYFLLIVLHFVLSFRFVADNCARVHILFYQCQPVVFVVRKAIMSIAVSVGNSSIKLTVNVFVGNISVRVIF